MGGLSLAVSHSLIRIEILSERHGVPAAVIGASVIRRRIALHTSTLGRSYPMARLLSPFGVSLSEVFRCPPCQRSSILCSGGGGLSLSRRSRHVATGEVAATEQCSIELGGIALHGKEQVRAHLSSRGDIFPTRFPTRTGT